MVDVNQIEELDEKKNSIIESLKSSARIIFSWNILIDIFLYTIISIFLLYSLYVIDWSDEDNKVLLPQILGILGIDIQLFLGNGLKKINEKVGINWKVFTKKKLFEANLSYFLKSETVE